VTIVKLVPEGTHVYPGDTVCILEASQVENNYLNALNELEIAKKEYRKTVENLALETLLLESQVKTIETSAQISRLDSVQSDFSSESTRRIIELEIQIAELEKEKIKNKLRFLQEINKSELNRLKLIIDQAQNDVNRAKASLDKLTITAQKEGLVLLSRHWPSGNLLVEGDIVWDRRSLLTIPDLSTLQAKLVVSESHYKRILPAQKVNIQVDAFPDVALTGKIHRKRGGGKKVQKDSQVKVYEISVKLDTIPQVLQPGLSLSCDVFIEEIRDTIAVPLICVFDRDSLKVVYVRNRNKFIERKVTVAGHSSTMALIADGLKENEVISTYIPSSNKIQ
jgi:multidrug efflux pump subunit AcrA (membrane-fusion protein)